MFESRSLLIYNNKAALVSTQCKLFSILLSSVGHKIIQSNLQPKDTLTCFNVFLRALGLTMWILQWKMFYFAFQKVHEMLKKGWDAEGSPFKGQDFDPSLFNIPPNAVQFWGYTRKSALTETLKDSDVALSCGATKWTSLVSTLHKSSQYNWFADTDHCLVFC